MKIKQELSKRIDTLLWETINASYNNSFNKLDVNKRLQVMGELKALTQEAIETNKRRTQKRLRNNKHLLNRLITSSYFKLDDDGINARRLLDIIYGEYASRKCYNADIMGIVKLLLIKMIYGKHDKEYADKVRQVITATFNNIDVEAITSKTQQYNGTWITTTSYFNDGREQERHNYHSHPEAWDKESAEKGKKNGETSIGFEWEGAFSSKKDFNDFCAEAKKTPFNNGFLYDERNYFMPTYDCSIRGGYTCEFWFCPMSVNFAKKFFNKFIELLKKHKWEASTEQNNAGTHAHIDANIFNQETLSRLYDIVYGESDDEKLARYLRDDNDYCKWDKESAIRYDNRYVKQDAQYNGKDIYIQEKVIQAKSRYALVNFNNAWYKADLDNNMDYDKLNGTIELRGWNAKKTPLDVIKDVVYFVNKATRKDARSSLCAE